MMRTYKILLVIATLATLLHLTTEHARADALRLTSSSQLSFDVTTATYTGAAGTTRSAPYRVNVGDNQLRFGFDTPGLSFYRFDSDGENTAFASGTRLIDTNGSYGPVSISFLKGLSEFGIFVQSSGLDTAAFTLTAYDGARELLSFTTDTIDNTVGRGAVSFLGLQAGGGDLITRLTVSSASSDEDFSNFFILGPAQFKTAPGAQPVPEPVSLLLLGTGLAGISARLRKRRSVSSNK